MSKRAAIATPGKQRLCVGLPMFFLGQGTRYVGPFSAHFPQYYYFKIW